MPNTKTDFETDRQINTEPLLRLRGIAKKFGGAVALSDVDFELRAGELHVLFGENGAGKSTLINIIAGTFPQDDGAFQYRGETVKALTPHRARAIGISPVFQEFSLVPSLTVQENLFLGREMSAGGLLKARAMRKEARRLIEDLGFDLDPTRRVEDLSRAHQQMTEIAKALLGNVKVLILDEPTASLTERETGHLFELIAKLKNEGVGIIYVSHRMREIRALADRITILRDGRLIKTVDAGSVSDSELVELMTGRKIEVFFPEIHHRPSAVAVEVEDLSLEGGAVAGANVYARKGEVVGIAGLVGCGKSELVRAIYGLERIKAGSIRIHGKAHDDPTPRQSLVLGAAYFPADRGAEGLALSRSIRENSSISALDGETFARFGVLRIDSERETVERITTQLKLRPPNIERAVHKLSGGNRQKVMLSRALTRDLTVFLFDEPTVGIDVGAKLEVYEFMKQLVEAGAAVIVVSSELPEVLALSNRLYVMHHGRVVAELEGDMKTEANVLASFFRDEINATEAAR